MEVVPDADGQCVRLMGHSKYPAWDRMRDGWAGGEQGGMERMPS